MTISVEPSTTANTFQPAKVLSDTDRHPLIQEGQGLPEVQGRSIKELGWTREEAADVRARLSSFEQGWDAPGMEAYDDL